MAWNCACHFCIFILPSKSLGSLLKRFMTSMSSRRSGCSSSFALMPSRSLSISVMKSFIMQVKKCRLYFWYYFGFGVYCCYLITETVWAISLLELPLSSLIVIGRSSLIRANAIGQSNFYFIIVVFVWWCVKKVFISLLKWAFLTFLTF